MADTQEEPNPTQHQEQVEENEQIEDNGEDDNDGTKQHTAVTDDNDMEQENNVEPTRQSAQETKPMPRLEPAMKGQPHLQTSETRKA